MIGVNCPEISDRDLGIKEEPYGRKAKAYTERQLAGEKVWLELDVQEMDNYDRLWPTSGWNSLPPVPKKKSGPRCSTPVSCWTATPRL